MLEWVCSLCTSIILPDVSYAVDFGKLLKNAPPNFKTKQYMPHVPSNLILPLIVYSILLMKWWQTASFQLPHPACNNLVCLVPIIFVAEVLNNRLSGMPRAGPSVGEDMLPYEPSHLLWFSYADDEKFAQGTSISLIFFTGYLFLIDLAHVVVESNTETLNGKCVVCPVISEVLPGTLDPTHRDEIQDHGPLDCKSCWWYTVHIFSESPYSYSIWS